jgi:hypothetical protein
MFKIKLFTIYIRFVTSFLVHNGVVYNETK